MDDSITSWIAALATITNASFSGVLLASFFRWSPAALSAGVPLAIAMGLGPFMLGLFSVLALTLFRGHDPMVQGFVIHAPLAILALWGVRRISGLRPAPLSAASSYWSTAINVVLMVLIAGLVATSLSLPVTRNDPLEYALVGRELFATGDLLEYPLLARASSPSGFYGPWTHPPLYPALISTMYTLQGQADSPGLMRMLGPWATLAAAAIIYAIGRAGQRPQVLAPLAAALFLATPLVFQGTCAAQIDPLPVLGISVLLGVILASAGGSVRDGLLYGLVLGFSLWTHSQAVLFPVLSLVAILLKNGWAKPRALALQLLTMASMAGLLAAWPYARNVLLFGSMISDSPAVFMLRELDWAQYFRVFRGLDNWIDKIQYGILKGWFEAENFSLMFWLASAGIGLVIARLWRQRGWRRIASGGLSLADASSVCSAGIVLCYLGGAVLAAILGQDIMLRNARYVLVLMPCIAVLAAEAVAEMGEMPR